MALLLRMCPLAALAADEGSTPRGDARGDVTPTGRPDGAKPS